MQKFWFVAFTGLFVGTAVHVLMVLAGLTEANFWVLLTTIGATTLGGFLGMRKG